MSAKSSTKENKSAIKITQKGADGYKAKRKGYRVYDSSVTGLFLYVGAGGSKAWSLLYTTRDKKRQTYRIGSLAQYDVISARAEARRLLGNIARGEDPADILRKEKADAIAAESRTLGLFLEGRYWDEYLSKRKTGQATKERIAASYREFMAKDMATITSDQLNRHRAKKTTKPATLNRDRIAVHNLFAYAVKKGLITDNPARKEHHEPFKKVHTDANRVRFLGQKDDHEDFPLGERERFDRGLATMMPKIQALIGLAMNTGMRRGELFSLKWTDIHLSQGLLTIKSANAKTGKQRIIPLNSKALAILKQWRGNVVKLDSEALVFPSDITGKRLTNVTRQWRDLMAKAEIEDFRFHDMRHDFASRLVMSRIPLLEVAELLGHTSTEMTLKYAHLDKEQLRSAVEVL